MDIPKQIKQLNKQLYPTGRAWGYVHNSEQVDTIVENFVDGLGNPFVDGSGNHFVSVYGSEASPSKRLINAFLKSYERLFADIFSILDTVIPDNDNFTEIDASNLERVLGIEGNTDLTLEERKQVIIRKQTYPNGIAERAHYLFIQDQLQANGFDVYVTENRFADGSGSWDVVNPDDMATEIVQMGTTEMGVADMLGELQGLDYTISANYIDETIDADYYDSIFSASAMGVGEMGVSEMELLETPPTDIQLRATFFIGGSSFPSKVTVPLERKTEFRQLILKLKPAHTIVYLYIDYT